MDAISNPVRTVLDLFASELSDIRFGDVDAKTLSTLASEVESAAEAVASAQATLDDARSKLQERQELLLQQAQRALAYARVYAEPDAGLSARIDAIALPRSARRARPETDLLTLSTEPPRRPRGRPRKTPATEPVLEGVAANAE
jgi:hypothetical protein